MTYKVISNCTVSDFVSLYFFWKTKIRDSWFKSSYSPKFNSCWSTITNSLDHSKYFKFKSPRKACSSRFPAKCLRPCGWNYERWWKPLMGGQRECLTGSHKLVSKTHFWERLSQGKMLQQGKRSDFSQQPMQKHLLYLCLIHTNCFWKTFSGAAIERSSALTEPSQLYNIQWCNLSKVTLPLTLSVFTQNS